MKRISSRAAWTAAGNSISAVAKIEANRNFSDMVNPQFPVSAGAGGADRRRTIPSNTGGMVAPIRQISEIFALGQGRDHAKNTLAVAKARLRVGESGRRQGARQPTGNAILYAASLTGAARGGNISPRWSIESGADIYDRRICNEIQG
jgi:hypothetical protein